MNATRPQVVAFDVMKTLFSFEPLRPKMEALGLAPKALEIWYGSILRDALALTVTTEYAPFEELAKGALEELIAEAGRAATSDEIKSVLETVPTLSSYPDVREGFETLKAGGVRVFMLSNGSKSQTEKLLANAELSHMVDAVLSTDEVKLFKPHRRVYEYAAQVAGVAPAQLALVAAHGWDCHGAKSAGLTAGWVKRREKKFSPAFARPDVGGETLGEVVRALLNLPD